MSVTISKSYFHNEGGKRKIMKMKTKLACFICFASMTVTAIMSGYIMYQETYEVIAKEEPVAEVSEADAETNETTPRTYVWTETINELPTSEMKHEFNLSQGKKLLLRKKDLLKRFALKKRNQTS
jgi:hypothetical protein